MIGKMLEEIVRRGEENLLRAVPRSVTMDSHLFLTIAQFGGLSNPNSAVACGRWAVFLRRSTLWNSLRVQIVSKGLVWCCMMENYEIVIVGAGFAGAATAYHLSRRGVGGILLIEQESIPGFHSSGRNAAMMRQCVPDPDLATLTRDGAMFLRHLPDDWPEPVQFKQNGSLLLGSGAGWSKLKQDAESGRSVGIDVVLWT